MTAFTVAPRAGVHPSRSEFSLGPKVSPTPARSLSEVVLRLAEQDPDRPIFHVLNGLGETTTMTAATLADRAGAVARGLRQMGVPRGGTVLLAQETSPELLASFFGCSLAGAIPCLVGLPTTAAQRLGWIDKVHGCIEAVRAQAVIADPDWVEPAQRATTRQYAHVLAKLESIGRSAPPINVAPHELAFMQFTSGTTARQKAIAISQQALRTNAIGLASNAEWREGDLTVGWLPLHHDMGLVATTLTSFLHGLSTVLMPPAAFMLRPSRWLWAVHAFRGTQSFAPNFAFQFSASRIPDRDLEGLVLSSWRRAYNAAEFIHRSTVEQFSSRFAPFGFDPDAIWPAYGLAENTVGVTCRCPGDPLSFDVVSRWALAREGVAAACAEAGMDHEASDELAIACVGRAFPGTEVRIADRAGESLPDRREGRILLRGESLFSGYFGDRSTRTPFPDGWFDTGDLGYLVAEQLYITGRTKDLIIKAGQNISPYSIEHVVSGVDGVRTGCVAALAVVNAATGTEDIVVVFETPRRDPAAIETLKSEIRERIRAATGLAPDRLAAVPPHSLPKTTSGKIRRSEIKQMFEAGTVPVIEEALAY